MEGEVVTLRPPKPRRVYVVLVDPDAKPKKVTRSLTVYNLTLDEVEKRVKGCFEEG